MRRKLSACVLAATALLAACSEDKPDASAYQEELMLALLDAKPGDVITIPSGVHYIDRTLNLNTSGVVLQGSPDGQAVLSFKGQKQGAEGILASGDDLLFQHFAIEDTIGDAIKVNEGKNIVMRKLRVEWTNGPDSDNGAYGLYPVQTENVLLEGNIVRGASDAGIYVGQSKNIIVRNNIARQNVAGIEIENSVDAEVYDNIAEDNTGGILVFNMPNLPQVGARTAVYRNVIKNNNTDNFAAAGTPVASVPSGSGVVVNSNDQVEIYQNSFEGNDTAHIIISSVYSSNFADRGAEDGFDAYPEAIYIHDNTYTGGGSSPGLLELKILKTAMFGLTGSLPAVLWDGFVDAEKMVDGALPADKRICIADEAIEVLNADAPGGFDDPRLTTEQHRCRLQPLGEVILPDMLYRDHKR